MAACFASSELTHRSLQSIEELRGRFGTFVSKKRKKKKKEEEKTDTTKQYKDIALSAAFFQSSSVFAVDRLEDSPK